MRDMNEMQDDFKKLLDSMCSMANEHRDASFEQYVNLQKELIERYREQLQREMDRDPINESMTEFSRMMMATTMQLTNFYRDNRKRMIEVQSTMAQAYLDLLEKSMQEKKEKKDKPDAG
jgi:hemerythrin superfamily protein